MIFTSLTIIQKLDKNAFLPAYGTTVFSSGFETGDFTDFSELYPEYNYPIVTQDNAYNGRYKSEFDGDGQYAEKTFTSIHDGYYQTSVMWIENPIGGIGSDNAISMLTIGVKDVSYIARMGIYGDYGNIEVGKEHIVWYVQVRHDGDFDDIKYIGASYMDIVPFKWYNIGIHAHMSTSDGTEDGSYTFYVNGVTLTSHTISGEDTDYTYVNAIRIERQISGAVYGINYFDDVSVTDSGFLDKEGLFEEDFNNHTINWNKWSNWTYGITNSSNSIRINNDAVNLTTGIGASYDPLQLTYHGITVPNGFLEISFDKWIPTTNGIGYVVFGNQTTWNTGTYALWFDTFYGSEFEIKKTSGSAEDPTTTTCYSRSGKPNWCQIKIRIVDWENISFWCDNTMFYSEDCSWFFTYPYWDNTYNERKMYLSFGAASYISTIDNIFYDNIFVTEGFNSDSQKQNVNLLPTSAINYGVVYPTPYLDLSQEERPLYYRSGLTVNYNAFPYEGFEVLYWQETNSSGTFNHENDNVDLLTYYNYNITVQIQLISTYRILNITALSLGLNCTPSYGIHAYPINSEQTVTAIENTVNPPNVTAHFQYWMLDGYVVSESLSYIVSMGIENHTLLSYSVLPTPNDTWQIRQVSILPDTPPAGDYYAERPYETLLMNLTTYMSYINQVGTRLYWSFNLTNDPYYGCYPNSIYLKESSPYQPTLEDTRTAIQMIHSYNLSVSLFIGKAWDGIYPSLWNESYGNWDNKTWSLLWLDAYNQTILFPIAQLCEEENVEVFGIGIEYGDPTYNTIWFNDSDINVKWTSIIASLRNVYNGNISQQIQAWAYENSFSVIRQCSYLKNLDYVQFAKWCGDLVDTEPFTALDIAEGWYYHTAEHNFMNDTQWMYEILGKKFLFNSGYLNSWTGIFHPWSVYPNYADSSFRYDSAMMNAWLGHLWALQPQEWCLGQDFEEYNWWYNETYGICGDSYFAGYKWHDSLMLLQSIQTAINNTLAFCVNGTNPYPEIPINNINASISNMEGCGNWVFADETTQYYFNAQYSHDIDASNITATKIGFYDGANNWISIVFNKTTSSFYVESGQECVTVGKGNYTLNGTYMNVSYPLTFKIAITDALNVSIWLNAIDAYGYESGFHVIQQDYFHIYSKGGRSSLYVSGIGGRFEGGQLLNLYAGSNTVNIESYVEMNITYRTLQHIHSCIFLDPTWLSGYHKPEEDTELYLNETSGYWEFGFDYCIGSAEFIKGWYVRISSMSFDGYPNSRWNLKVDWYNQENLIKTENVTCYFEEDKDNNYYNNFGRLWIDLWFGKENASSVEGRVSSYYKGWNGGTFPWDGGSPSTNSYISIFGEALKDENGSILSISEIKLVNFRTKIFRNGNLTVNTVFRIAGIEALDYQLGTKLDGVDEPILVEAKDPKTYNWGFFEPLRLAIMGFFSAVVDGFVYAFSIVGKVLTAGLDAFLLWITGQPNLFSNFMNGVYAFINYVYTFAVWIRDGLASLITFLQSAFSLFGSGIVWNFISFIANAVTGFITTIESGITFIIDMWNGTGQFAGGIAVKDIFFLFIIVYPIVLFGRVEQSKSFDPIFSDLEKAWMILNILKELGLFGFNMLYRVVKFIMSFIPFMG